MNVKKILIYSWNIPKGGLAKVILKEYEFFKKKDYNVTLATSEPLSSSYSTEFKNTGINIIGVNGDIEDSKEKDISNFFPGLRIFIHGGTFNKSISIARYLLREKPTIILAHQLLSAILVLPYSLIYRIPFILVLHDNSFLFMEKENLERLGKAGKLAAFFALWIGIYTVHCAKVVICTTDNIRKEISRFVRVQDVMWSVPYGFDKLQRQPKSGRHRLMTVSKWSEFRRPRAYLEMLAFLPDPLTITMAGRWDSKQELLDFRKEILKAGMQNRLLLLDDLSEGELYKLYNETRVFFRLGFNEKGTGQAILEAISHGCPVVISKGLGASELITDGVEGYLVDESDLENVANKIRTVYEDDRVFERMSDGAYKLSKLHGWENFLNKIQEAITR